MICTITTRITISTLRRLTNSFLHMHEPAARCWKKCVCFGMGDVILDTPEFRESMVNVLYTSLNRFLDSKVDAVEALQIGRRADSYLSIALYLESVLFVNPWSRSAYIVL